MLRPLPALPLLALLFAGGVLLAPATAAAVPALPAVQEDDEEKYKFREDPYTEDDPEAWAAAGYLGRDRMKWGDGHGTVDIDQALGGVEVLWVETAHFRIGCSLPEYKIDSDSKDEKEKIRAELKLLQERIPSVPLKPKRLDKWLRLHLYAMRLETLYEEIETLLGVTEEDLPTGPGQLKNGEYMGEGPYLGMTEKFTVLLFEKESSVGRYRNRYVGQSGSEPTRHLWPQTGTMLFVAAQENPGLASDTTMHCMVAYAVTLNLINGFKYYTHELPSWVPVGLGHWFARQVNPKRNYFTEDRIFSEDDKDVWDWAPRVRARVDHEYFPGMTKVFEWKDPLAMKPVEHMMSWARVDYLMHNDRDGLARFVDAMTGRLAGAGQVITPDIVFARQPAAFEEAFGVSPAEMDAAFAEWVLENYPKK